MNLQQKPPLNKKVSNIFEKFLKQWENIEREINQCANGIGVSDAHVIEH